MTILKSFLCRQFLVCNGLVTFILKALIFLHFHSFRKLSLVWQSQKFHVFLLPQSSNHWQNFFVFDNINISKPTAISAHTRSSTKTKFSRFFPPLNGNKFRKGFKEKVGESCESREKVHLSEGERPFEKGQNKYSINLIYSPDTNVFVLCVTSFLTASVLFFLSCSICWFMLGV